MSTRALAVVCGVAVLVLAALPLGSAWWLVAAVGAAAAAVASHAPRAATVQAVAAVVLAGATPGDRWWLWVVLGVGTVASIELQAVADRVTVVRLRPSWRGPLVVVAAASAVATGVAVVGAVDTDASVPLTLVAAAGAVAVLRASVLRGR